MNFPLDSLQHLENNRQLSNSRLVIHTSSHALFFRYTSLCAKEAASEMQILSKEEPNLYMLFHGSDSSYNDSSFKKLVIFFTFTTMVGI